MKPNATAQALLAALPDAVLATDATGKITGLNGDAEHLFRHSHADLVGRSFAEALLAADHRAAHAQWIAEFENADAARPAGHRVETRMQDADGRDFPVEAGLVRLEEDGEIAYLFHIRELTDRQTREQQLREACDKAERANSSKSFVISMVAHDMRNALGGVTGGLALLDRKRLTGSEREIIAGVDDSASNLKRLLNDTLDLARLESGEIEIAAAPFALRDFIADLSQAWRVRLAEAEVEFAVTIGAGTPERLMLDAHRLRQIVANLVSNATKYAPGTRLSLGFEPRGVEGLCITVTDTGPGFSAAALETAFEPFKRPAGQSASGAGLGLAIVRTITEAMDGTVLLSQGREGGARITIEFPTCRLSEIEPSAPIRHDRKGLSVLLVEDNATNRLVAARMLEKIGCNVALVEDGESGAIAAERKAFDAIFMDIDLPRLNGKDAIRRIRAGGGPNSQAPIIAFTAFAIRSQREEILASGADSILPKPVSGPEDFSNALSAVLRRNSPPEPIPANDGGEVIDFKRLISLKQTLGDGDFALLSGEFRRDLMGVLDTLADTAHGPQALRKGTHVAISLTGTLGAARAQHKAERLGEAIHNLGPSEIETRRAELEAALREAIGALDGYLEAS